MSIPSLEDRLRAIEDRLAIYTLIASHPLRRMELDTSHGEKSESYCG